MSGNKRLLFFKRRMRNRSKIKNIISGRLRLTVHRSSKNIYAQLIDDIAAITIASASSTERLLNVRGKNNKKVCYKVGIVLARRAKKTGYYGECYFDRGGFLFHGKVKALADAARDSGLIF